MAKRMIKVQDGERLDDESIERVKEHLANGGTKKDAYDILNIKANPTRLARIIEQYDERQAVVKRIRKEKRGTPASESEVAAIIKGALDGDSLTSIADDLYRPVDFVKRVIEGVGIPQKQTGSWWDRRFQSSIPDQCISESFDKYEIVWSDKYNGLAIVLDNTDPIRSAVYVIEKVEEEPKFAINGKVYTGYGGFHAVQRNEELGSLKHLEKYGIDLKKLYQPFFPNWLS